MKKILRLAGRIVVGLLLVVAVTAVGGLIFIETSLGKRTLAGVVESLAGEKLNGSLSIGAIRGNLFRHLTLADVQLKDSQNRDVAHIANVVVDWRVARLRPLQIVVSAIQVEQPKVSIYFDAKGRSNLGTLLKPSEGSESRSESSKESSEPSQPSVAWIQNVRLIEGRIDLKGPGAIPALRLNPISAQAVLPETLDRLPVAVLSAQGTWGALPIQALAQIDDLEKSTPAKLSGVAKGPIPGSEQVIQAKASVGHSNLAMLGQGVIDFKDLFASRFALNVNQIHYDSVEFRKAYSGAPTRSIDGKVFVDLRDRKINQGVEIHLEKRGKFLVESSMEDLADGKRIRLERVRLDGDKRCPLLVMEKPATLWLAKGAAVPNGDFKIAGCAGDIHYFSGGKDVGLDVRAFLPAKYLAVLGIPQPAIFSGGDLGTINLNLRLPEGPSVPNATAKFDWTFSGLADELRAEVKLDAQVERAGLRLNSSAQLGEGEEGRLDVRFAGDKVFKPGAWELSIPTASAKLDISAPKFDLKRLYKAGLVGSSIDEKLAARISGVLKERKLAVDGSVGLGTLNSPLKLSAKSEIPASGDFAKAKVDWDASAKDFDLSSLLPAQQFYSEERARVLANLKASGSGEAAAQQGEARISLSTHEKKAGRKEVVSVDARFNSEFADGSVLANNGSLDRLLEMATGALRTEEGLLNSDLRFHIPLKTAATPELSGKLNLRAKKIRVASIATNYDLLSVDIAGRGSSIVLDKLELHAGGGSLKGQGEVSLADKNPLNAAKLKATFEDFEALSSDQMRMKTSGGLDLTMDRSLARFGGKIEIDQGEIIIPDSSKNKSLEPVGELEDVVLETLKDEKSKNKEKTESLALQGSIHVRAPGRLWVRSENKDINIELRAELDAGLDEASEPFARGTVVAQRGSAEVFGRRFEIKEAIVELQGDPTDPQIHAEALYRANPRSILVSLNGDPKNIKPVFSSDPPGYSQDECLGVLLTGSPDFQRQSGGGGGGVGGVMTGFLIGKMKDQLGPLLPFDTFTAQLPSDSDQSSSRDPNKQAKIEVGKYLTDRIFVKYGRVFNSESGGPENLLSFDYRLSRRWSIATSTHTERARGDLELQWSLDYK